MAETILGALRRFNRWVALAVGASLLLCAGFVLLDIVLRRFHASFGGTDEISGYVMAIATSWGMAYALSELGHVRIDLIRSRGGPRLRALFDLFALSVLAATVSLIALKCWPVLERSILNSSRANTPLETPLALVQWPWMAGWIWFAIASWVTVLAAAALLLQGRHDAVHRHIGITGEIEEAEAAAVAALRPENAR
ncbi:TRAP transporter small permease [Halovulum dunhuangense]|uniref:TRAP transporter small permease protein n=1 Tax=Halovulum dunhuangense TaxID=1505036 RepID=A0A849L6E7_9RHOB|nr:TRAP transporter small permease [Halovulum dunhuangense]NNU81966.1 TRAP transporter small permease [Halovulum dunhuangense]